MSKPAARPRGALQCPPLAVPPPAIELRNRQHVRRLDTRRLIPLAHALLHELGVTAGELSVVFVDAPFMARLNQTYLGHTGSTDVITFDYHATPSPTPAAFVQGELFVCVEAAIEQARLFRVTWQSELVRYLVHGVLHLRGYDDLEAGPRRRMKREEDRLVKALAQRFEVERIGKVKQTLNLPHKLAVAP